VLQYYRIIEYIKSFRLIKYNYCSCGSFYNVRVLFHGNSFRWMTAAIIRLIIVMELWILFTRLGITFSISLKLKKKVRNRTIIIYIFPSQLRSIKQNDITLSIDNPCYQRQKLTNGYVLKSNGQRIKVTLLVRRLSDHLFLPQLHKLVKTFQAFW